VEPQTFRDLIHGGIVKSLLLLGQKVLGAVLHSVLLPAVGMAEGEHEPFVHAADEISVVDFCNAVVTESATSALARAICLPANQNSLGFS